METKNTKEETKEPHPSYKGSTGKWRARNVSNVGYHIESKKDVFTSTLGYIFKKEDAELVIKANELAQKYGELEELERQRDELLEIVKKFHKGVRHETNPSNILLDAYTDASEIIENTNTK